MGLRPGVVISSDDEPDLPPENARASTSTCKRRLRKQFISETDSASTQHSPYVSNASSVYKSDHKNLRKACKLVTEDNMNIGGEKGKGIEDVNDSTLRKIKDGKRGRRRGVRSSQYTKEKTRCIYNGLKDSPVKKPKFASNVSAQDLEAEDEYSTGKGISQQAEEQLDEDFEPGVLQDNYMTAKDKHIRATDIPERLQLLEDCVSTMPPAEQRSRLANWIYDRAFGHLAMSRQEELKYIAEINKSEVVEEINFVLTQLHDNKLEIPFVAMYRKEGCMRLLSNPEKNTRSCFYNGEQEKLNRYEALWQVYFWDKKWCLLQQRKGLLKEAYEKRQIQGNRDTGKGVVLETLVRTLQDAESEQAVDDVDAKFNLHFPPKEVNTAEGPYKRPKRQSYYSTCCASGWGDIARQFGLTPKQFGENLQAMQKIHDVCDPPFSPEDIAMRFCIGKFDNPEIPLKGSRHMAACEISSEPTIREYVRILFWEQALVNTKPTRKGNVMIDKFHQYSSVKWVREKRVNTFDQGHWLLIERAEEEELLEVTVELSQEVMDTVLLQRLNEQYLSTGSSTIAELWNEQRKQILKDSLLKMLLPVLQKETRMLLTLRAKAWVQQGCADALWKRVYLAPYPHPKLDLDGKTVTNAAPRVLACCWGPRNSPTTFVMLDTCGEIIGTLQTGYLNVHAGSSELLQRKMSDQQKLQKFIMEHQPHVVVVGATNLMCRYLKAIILETVSKILEENPCSVNTGVETINVEYGEESLPLLYERSQVSMEQLAGQPNIVRRAVALGRHLQNPLAMVASLCGPSKEIVALKLHSMQMFLTVDELYDVVEQVMITVTNQVGVDVNLAASHEWLFAPLQFVSGLGPRKAYLMQKSIQSIRWISSRKQLLSYPLWIKKTVFVNCCGFLRIRNAGRAISAHKRMNPLDDTRIHPESYELAKDLAVHIYCTEIGGSCTEIDEELTEKAISYIRQHPDLLRDLDLGIFISSIQRTMADNVETLEDIKMELLNGFRDCRAQYVQPTQDEEFAWLTGEDEVSLAEGMVVNATARKIYENRVMCVLESGIWGILQKHDLIDDIGIDLSSVVFEGSILTCRVTSILKDKFLVELTCREDNTAPETWQGIDEPYIQSVLQSDTEHDSTRVNYFRPRAIVHPHFQNISMADAIKVLSDRGIGEVVFHPSNKGPSCLSMTLKFHDDVYVHQDIMEDEKDVTDLTRFLHLGKTLKIEDKSFIDLDEVIACYVDPFINRLKQMLGFKQFRCGTDTEINNFLHEEMNLCPGSIAYCFSICRQHPGAITVSYLRDMDIQHEIINLHPEGYKFRMKMFSNIDKLVNYFKSVARRSNRAGSTGNCKENWNSGRGQGGGMHRGGRSGSIGRGNGFRRRSEGFEGKGRNGKFGGEAHDSEARGRFGMGISGDDRAGNGSSVKTRTDCISNTGWGSDKREDGFNWENGVGSGSIGAGDGLLGRWGGDTGGHADANEMKMQNDAVDNHGWSSPSEVHDREARETERCQDQTHGRGDDLWQAPKDLSSGNKGWTEEMVNNDSIMEQDLQGDDSEGVAGHGWGSTVSYKRATGQNNLGTSKSCKNANNAGTCVAKEGSEAGAGSWASLKPGGSGNVEPIGWGAISSAPVTEVPGGWNAWSAGPAAEDTSEQESGWGASQLRDVPRGKPVECPNNNDARRSQEWGCDGEGEWKGGRQGINTNFGHVKIQNNAGRGSGSRHHVHGRKGEHNFSSKGRGMPGSGDSVFGSLVGDSRGRSQESCWEQSQIDNNFDDQGNCRGYSGWGDDNNCDDQWQTRQGNSRGDSGWDEEKANNDSSMEKEFSGAVVEAGSHGGWGSTVSFDGADATKIQTNWSASKQIKDMEHNQCSAAKEISKQGSEVGTGGHTSIFPDRSGNTTLAAEGTVEAESGWGAGPVADGTIESEYKWDAWSTEPITGGSLKPESERGVWNTRPAVETEKPESGWGTSDSRDIRSKVSVDPESGWQASTYEKCDWENYGGSACGDVGKSSDGLLGKWGGGSGEMKADVLDEHIQGNAEGADWSLSREVHNVDGRWGSRSGSSIGRGRGRGRGRFGSSDTSFGNNRNDRGRGRGRGRGRFVSSDNSFGNNRNDTGRGRGRFGSSDNLFGSNRNHRGRGSDNFFGNNSNDRGRGTESCRAQTQIDSRREDPWHTHKGTSSGGSWNVGPVVEGTGEPETGWGTWNSGSVREGNVNTDGWNSGSVQDGNFNTGEPESGWNSGFVREGTHEPQSGMDGWDS